MRKLVVGAVAAMAVYIGCQLTIGMMLNSELNKIGTRLAASEADDDSGMLGSFEVGSDICTMLAGQSGAMRMLSRLVFPQPNAAAEKLRQSYRFEVAQECRRGRGNRLLAYRRSRV